MQYNNLIILILLKYCYSTFSISLTQIVETKNGALIGEIIENDKAKYFYYKSIPYAQAPTGELRFEAPIPLDTNWTGILNATRTAPKCMQWITGSTTTASTIVGEEDCLYLNIFVPNIPQSKDEVQLQLLPAMVFIHGGGLMWGSADFYGEDYIMQNGGIILITLNYRLGPFGFLSTEDTEIAGNMGFKDQALALQWVHENIMYFGGDKERVLLAGWSAGGASVNFHMISEMTNDKWFSSAASFSGTALCPCHAIYPGEALKKPQLLALYLNCTTKNESAENTSTKILKNCLKTATAIDIMSNIPKFYKFSNHPFAIFGPVIEKSSNITTTFLTDHVENLMRSGKIKRKPWLLARTSEDGAFGTAEFLKKDENGHELIETLEERWLEWAPIMLFLNPNLTKEQQENLVLVLKQHYFGDNATISVDNYKMLENLYNEELSTKHVNKVVELYVNFTVNAEAYGYVYDNPAQFGFGHVLAEREDWKFGTLHGDDIFLIFKTEIRKQHPFRKDEQDISSSLIELLVQMAKTGVPAFNGHKLNQLAAVNQFKFTKITKNGINEFV